MRWLALLGFACAAAACDRPSIVTLPEAGAANPSGSVPAAVAAPPPSSSPTADVPPPSSVAAQHILVAYKGAKGAPKSVTRSKPDARKRAEEALARIRAGEDFTALVKVYSDDTGTLDRLGSVGKFTRDKMDKAFADAAFALKVDEVSGVVETPFGFHLIKRNQ
jgi:parvulin-like peptidyl-prolyl cis-trans isomerase-like protein